MLPMNAAAPATLLLQHFFNLSRFPLDFAGQLSPLAFSSQAGVVGDLARLLFDGALASRRLPSISSLVLCFICLFQNKPTRIGELFVRVDSVYVCDMTVSRGMKMPLRYGRVLAEDLWCCDYFNVALLVGNLNSHGIIPAFEK